MKNLIILLISAIVCTAAYIGAQTVTSALGGGRKTLNNSATAVQLTATNTWCRDITVVNEDPEYPNSNTAEIYIGGASVSRTNSPPLRAQHAITYHAPDNSYLNAAAIYVLGHVDSQKIYWYCGSAR
jgi:hypothetical protein